MGLVDLIFPRSCLSCGNQGRYVCDSCIKKVPSPKLVCPECQRPSIDGFTHIKCKRTLSLDGIISIWCYQGVVRTALLKLKYAYAREIATEISVYTNYQLDKFLIALPKNPTLVPIPLYFLKENLRGFNQTEILGKAMAMRQTWKFVPDLLLRKMLKKPQAELKGDERKENIKGVFALNSFYQPLITNHQSLILFDDIYTTGSTLKEACKVLKRNGANVVWGLTIAR